MRSATFGRHFRRLGWLLCACVACTAGCQRSELNTQYGAISGNRGSDSLNGVSVLADMYSSRGFQVKRRQKISPRINQFNTIVWFPDDYSCPSEDAIDALDRWLDGDVGRTLIYVGRDYDARADYFRDVLINAPVERREELLRRIAESNVDRAERSEGTELFWFDENVTQCEWFNQERVKRRKTNVLSGELTDGLTSGSAQVELSTLLQPSEEGSWNTEALLTAAGNAFVSQRFNNRHDYVNPMIIISNGSFLLNYALVDPGNQKMATNLIDRCDSNGGVLFLESGPMGIDVSDSDTSNHNQWAWIGEAPLRYIVPHFLVWGVLFCFVFFPIFGRPQRIDERSTSSFRTHVNAIGKLMGRSNQPNRAIKKIDDYHSLISGESKRN